MPAARVVPADVGDESKLKVEARGPVVAARELSLERRDHALGHGVVERRAGAPATRGDAGLLQALGVLIRGVRAVVRMCDQNALVLGAGRKRHLEGVTDEALTHVRGELPATMRLV